MSARLVEAAKAVLVRWDSPKWEWTSQGPTANLMATLRVALAEAAAQPVPLTDELIDAIPFTGFDENRGHSETEALRMFARAVERHHGIGGKP